MKPEQQRIAIAEACGLTGWRETRALPDYLNDLNAMHEVEKVLTGIHRQDYFFALDTLLNLEAPHATASQRAEAFLRTLNLWI